MSHFKKTYTDKSWNSINYTCTSNFLQNHLRIENGMILEGKVRGPQEGHIHFLCATMGLRVFFAPSRNVGCRKSSASEPNSFCSWTSTGSSSNSLKLSVSSALSTSVNPLLSRLSSHGDWPFVLSKLLCLSVTDFNMHSGWWLLMMHTCDFKPRAFFLSWAVGRNDVKICKQPRNFKSGQYRIADLRDEILS